MFIVAPSSHRNTTIVYNDTVLDLKALGSNIVPTTIYSVNTYEMQSCVNLIIRNNPTVNFNTIQISKANRSITFYADQKIDIKVWQESKIKLEDPISISVEQKTLMDLKHILATSLANQYNNEFINISKVNEIVKNKYVKEENILGSYCTKIANRVNDSRHTSVWSNFDYEKKELRINILPSHRESSSVLYFKKDDNNILFLSKRENDLIYNSSILMEAGDIINNLFDNYLAKEEYYNKENKIDFDNTNLTLVVTKDRYYITNNKMIIDKDCFEFGKCYRHFLGFDSSDINNSKSFVLSQFMRENSKILLDHAKVNVNDLPQWMIEEINLEKNKTKRKSLFWIF